MDRLQANADLIAILQGIADGVTLQAPDGSLIYANDAAARLSGYPSAAAMLATPAQAITGRFELMDEAGRLFPPDQLPGRQVLRGLPAQEVVLRIRERLTGEERWRSVAATPIFDEQGQLRFVVNVFRDVTPLKRAETQQRFLADAGRLLASSLDYRTTLSHLTRLAVPEIGDWCAVDMLHDGQIQRLAVAHVDPEKVRLANDLWERYPPNPANTAGLPNVLRTGRSELYAEIHDALLEASAANAEHLAILRGVGLRSAMIVPLVARGRTLGAVTIVAAESGRRYGQADLAFAEALAARAALAVDNAELYGRLQQELLTRDQFLAAASHDLKNPLASIKGTAQLLHRALERVGTIDPGRLRAALGVIDRTTTRMTRLVDGLLDVTRLQLGQTLELEREPTDLALLLREVTAESQQATERHQIRVEGVESLVGEWDAARLGRVLSNLLDNAIKYSPDGGEILVSLAGEDNGGGSWAVLAVQDRGLGVPPEDRARIFERFQRGSNVAGRLAGSGLGLAGARLIVEQHGGTIAVAERAGGGTTFTVRLPLREHQPAVRE